MFSYVSFFNDTSYPFISVYDEDCAVAECLPRHTKSKYCLVDAGSMCATLCDNHNTPFLSLYIALAPNKFHVVRIRDHFSEFM